MVERWPGVFIPSVPEKQALGNLKTDFIEQRKVLLNQFVLNISNQQSLFYSDEFRIFLRASNENFEKSINALPKQSYSDIINKFQFAFPDLAGKEINSELELKIT